MRCAKLVSFASPVRVTWPRMSQPRPGKRLLVLDLDYTVLDCDLGVPAVSALSRLTQEQAWQDRTAHALDFARPGLDEFLTAVCASCSPSGERLRRSTPTHRPLFRHRHLVRSLAGATRGGPDKAHKVANELAMARIEADRAQCASLLSSSSAS